MRSDGAIRDIYLENFKSYEGRVRVGPLQQFTCVVGPNGAGKSNLVDAVAFVLCCQVGDRRRHNSLVDLVHQKEGEAAHCRDLRTAAVELVYEHNAIVTIFRRTIQPAVDTSVYFIDGVAVDQQEYLNRLEGINMLSKTRNFLVFQGDVETTATRHGRDLVTFFEQISGSGALREEFERLAARKAQKEEEARHLFHKKKCAMSEKKVLAQEKLEAERYLELERNFKQLNVEYYLFRLYGMHLRQHSAEQTRASLQASRCEMDVEMAGNQRNLEASCRRRADAHLAAQRASLEVVAAQRRLENLHIEVGERKKALEAAEALLDELRSKEATEIQRRQQTEHQIETAAADKAKWAATLDEQEAIIKKEIFSTPEQLGQFEEAQKEATRLTASDGLKAKELEAQLRITTAERARFERELREAEGTRQHLERRVNALAEAQRLTANQLSHDNGQVQQLTLQLLKLDESDARNRSELQALRSEREQLCASIQDIRAAERQIKREEGLAKVVANLVQLIPGVRGRVMELCRPKEDRFRVPVNVALGGYMDAVVTDTAATAMNCIRYLKEHMLEPMLFLPMDNVQVQRADSRLHDLVCSDPNGSLHLALNCLEFDDHDLTNVFRFMVGDVVFARELTVASHYAFSSVRKLGLSCRFVSLTGETISREGNLAVNSDVGTTRFEFAALAAKRQRLEVIDTRLREQLSLEGSTSTQRDILKGERQRLESKRRDLEQKQYHADMELRNLQGELKRSVGAVEELGPELDRLKDDEERFTIELRNVENSISQCVFKHFKRLSEDMGVDDIRQCEHDFRRKKEGAQLKRREALHWLSSCDAEISMLRQSLREMEGAHHASSARACESQIGGIHEEVKSLTAQAQIAASDSQAAATIASQAVDQENKAEQEVVDHRRVVRDGQRKLREVEQQLISLATDIEDLREAKSDLLRRSLLEDVEVPLKSTDAAGEGNGQLPVIDFDTLPGEKRAAAVGPSAKLLEEEYRTLLRSATAELERARPNLKAMEQLSSAAGQADDAAREAAQAHREIEEARQAFEAVRAERRTRFMLCYNRVAAEIGTVYEALSRPAVEDTGGGGTAYLDLEDLEDPYNSGLRFTVMPPMKRFMDVGMLSGGERALAALALIFAVQTYQRPPFLVLDEVDAHLDASGVYSLASFVADRGMQTLVVSLRDAFYSKSEALVGVSKNQQEGKSVVLTLDLSQFRQLARPPLQAPPVVCAPLQEACADEG